MTRLFLRARIFLFAFSFLTFSVTRIQAAESFTWTTLAGGAQGTNDGVNGSAQFYFPSGIAVDGAGNLFVADTSNNTIRKVAPAGPDWVVTTIAGTAAFGAAGGTNDGVNGAAQFWRPNGVWADKNGNVFVVDHYTHTIRKITPVGTNWVVTTIAGLGQTMATRMARTATRAFGAPRESRWIARAISM